MTIERTAFGRSPLGAFIRSPLRARARSGELAATPVYYIGADCLYRIDNNLEIVNSSDALTDQAITAVLSKSYGGGVIAGGYGASATPKIWRLESDLSAILTERANADMAVGTRYRGFKTRLAYGAHYIAAAQDDPSGLFRHGSDGEGNDLLLWKSWPTGSPGSKGWQITTNPADDDRLYVASEQWDKTTYPAVNDIVVTREGGSGFDYFYSSSTLSNCFALTFSGGKVYLGHSTGLVRLSATLVQEATGSSPQVYDLAATGSGLYAACEQSGGKIVRKFNSSFSELATGEGDADYATSVIPTLDGNILVTAVSPTGEDVYLYDSDLNLIRSARRFSGEAFCAANIPSV